MKLFTISDHNEYENYAIVMAESEEEAKQKFLEELKNEANRDLNVYGEPVMTFEQSLEYYDINHITEIKSGVVLAERA